MLVDTRTASPDVGSGDDDLAPAFDLAESERDTGPMSAQDAAKPSQQQMQVLVRAMTLLAADTLAVELVPSDDVELPAFEAGAHVDLLLPNGIRRSYSLCNRPTDRNRYVVGVKKANPSRGASSYIHDHLRVGQRIEITGPRNNFPLAQAAERSIFIAGGIGITPIWSMIQTLESDGRPWKLFYAARTSKDAAFLRELQALGAAGCQRAATRAERHRIEVRRGVAP